MSELQIIESALQRAAKRGRWARALRGLWQGLLVGAVLAPVGPRRERRPGFRAGVPQQGSVAEEGRTTKYQGGRAATYRADPPQPGGAPPRPGNDAEINGSGDGFGQPTHEENPHPQRS